MCIVNREFIGLLLSSWAGGALLCAKQSQLMLLEKLLNLKKLQWGITVGWDRIVIVAN